MSFMPGDIVLISHAPYTNRLSAKARPCLVISGFQFNENGPDLFLAPISSVIRYGDTKQVVIESSDASFADTGLRVRSAIKCGAIFAYSKSQVCRKLGLVQSQILEQVTNKVIDILTTD
ncbi:MAG: type II toxin-antitoxin system PemK/MazF family toxin [Planctomycetes bacterium]|nr:type II toxin-antitoxin system PemK/MazF family toxin [Planctomycetota bacterium]